VTESIHAVVHTLFERSSWSCSWSCCSSRLARLDHPVIAVPVCSRHFAIMLMMGFG